MIGLITDLLIQVVGLIVQLGWPVLKTHEYLKKGEHKTQWLTYWVLYFAVYFVESLLGAITGISGSSLTYTVLKTILFLWLVHPTYLGASWIYSVLIENHFQAINVQVGPLIAARFFEFFKKIPTCIVFNQLAVQSVCHLQRYRLILSMKKALVIFDLNKTLFYARKNSRIMTFDTDAFEKMKPNEVIDGTKLYYRQGRNQLLDLLFLQQREFFDVGIWSSLDKDKTSAFAKVYFERYYKNLAFVSATRREEYEGVKSEHSIDPIAVKKDINQLFDKFPVHDLNTTIVVSNFLNLLPNYVRNKILKQYDPKLMGAKFTVDYSLFALTKYLSGIRILTTTKGITDVRQILKTKSFDDTLARIENHQLGFTVYK